MEAGMGMVPNLVSRGLFGQYLAKSIDIQNSNGSNRLLQLAIELMLWPSWGLGCNYCAKFFTNYFEDRIILTSLPINQDLLW